MSSDALRSIERPVDISVVIPARNAAATLGAQLEALAAQDCTGSWEVIVVDNGSTDGTAGLEQLSAGKGFELRVIPCSEPGVNRARNTGIRAARAEKILCCDADDIVGTDWVGEISRALDRYDMVGGRIDVEQLNSPVLRQSRPNECDTSLPSRDNHLPYALTANLGLHRHVFDAVGGFDESFTTGGGDEVDFCWRAQYAGFTLGFEPSAVVHYRYRADLKGFCRQFYHYALGCAKLRRKHEDLGQLATEAPAMNRRKFWRRCKPIVRIDLLLDEAARYRYLRRAAWLWGACVGYWKYRVFV